MAGVANVSALAAWAGAPDAASGVGRQSAPARARAPFRSALFDDPQAAVSAALLLYSAMPHGEVAGLVTIGIAIGDADAALREANEIAANATPGSVLLSAAAVEAVGRRLPDGMALRAEPFETRGRTVAAFALRTARDVMPHALPAPPTRLVGRRTQLRDLRDRLESHRLVSLTGPPGSGKTRLAVELGQAMLGGFPDGAWFVPLAPIQDPDMIAQAVAQTLGLAEVPGRSPVDVVAAHLEARELLLLIDNFEHVLDGATIIAEWLSHAPRLHVIVTSRAALRLSGEHEYAVPPLIVPSDPSDPAAAGSEAVQLFSERALAIDPGFVIDERTLPDIARICRRLDGLPLALEIAAARTKALPIPAILARLEQSLDLLTHAARDVPERHRSLHAAVSWSYGLLTHDEQVFLRRLSVFQGGWTPEAADAVTQASAELGDDPLQLITSLLDKSLVRRQADTGEPRYDMLETIREYARERLEEEGETQRVAERHARWFMELAEAAAPSLTGPERGMWLDRMEREQDNFRAAMRWSASHAVELAMRLGAALWRFWQIRSHIGEGRRLLADLLAVEADVDAAIRARLLSAAGSLAYWQNDAAAALHHYEASLSLRRAVDDPRELASALYDLGHALSALDQTHGAERGRDLELEALEIYRTLEDRIGVAWLTWALGCNSHFAGHDEEAVVELGESVEMFRALDDPFGLAWALTMQGLSASRIGRLDLAGRSWREALQIFAGVDDMSGIDTVLEHLARLAAAKGEHVRAIRLAAAGKRARGVSEAAIAEIVYGTSDAAKRGSPVSPEETESARSEGEAMSTAEAVAYALEMDGPVDPSLRVHALGRMIVERSGTPIRRWGGEKAGSRQAQAIFAFLFDRAGAGITKDEATELLWPELPIQRADLAFHRTLGGLRSVLERGDEDGRAIAYEAGRYRLADGLVAWSDVGTLEGLLDRAADAEPRSAVDLLEEARALYRGDLFDDCPFYGDSSFVEERRTHLRGRYEGLLVQLGDRLRARGEDGAASACYREALSLNPESTAARRGLDQVGDGTADQR